MVGRFDALSKRIDNLESTLTDNVIVTASETETNLEGLRQQLNRVEIDASPADWINVPANWMSLQTYGLLVAIAYKNDIDPNIIREAIQESLPPKK